MAVRNVQTSTVIHRYSSRSGNLLFCFKPPELRVDSAVGASKALSIELRRYVSHGDSLDCQLCCQETVLLHNSGANSRKTG